MGSEDRRWLKRTFSRPVEDLLRDPAPAVPLAIQEWVEARVQIAAEQAKAAFASARERQEMQLAAAVEEVAARTSAHLQASLDLLREETETRVQIGARQAMSYAEQGVAALGSALKGVAKALASLKRDVEVATASERRAISGIEADLIAIQAALESRMNRHEAQIAAVAASAESADSDHEALEKRIASLGAQIAAVETGVGAVVSDHAELGSRITRHDDQIALVAAKIGSAVSDNNAGLRLVEKRIEFVRQETMYELQASIMRVAGKRPDENNQTTSRIVSTGKIDEMRKTGLRLNIGCGHVQHDDYINVDARQLPGVDVIAEATDIPFASEEIQEIASAHLVEHFTAHILDRVLLPYWKSLLKPGGQLTTVAPDGAAMLAAVNDGTMSFEDFREVLFGAQDYDGDFHFNLITPDSFSAALARAGFVGIEKVYAEKRNGKCFEFKIVARKP